MPQYQSSEAKAEDNRSSAYTLLAVGGVGFIAVLLIFFNVIPIYRNAGITKYLVCGVMCAMPKRLSRRARTESFRMTFTPIIGTLLVRN